MECVENSIAVNLSPLTTSKAMWEYLKRIYQQSNEARVYQLEQEISLLTQDSRTIQEFYSPIMMLWNEMDMIDSNIPENAIATVLSLRQRSRTRQFLIKLQSDFEHVRASILNRGGPYISDMILAELLADETRLNSLSSYSVVCDTAFVANRGKLRDLGQVQCFNCNEKGHFANQYKNKKGNNLQ